MSTITHVEPDQRVHLVDPKTKKVVESYRTKHALRNATGLGSKPIYDRIGQPLDEQEPILIREGQHRGEFLITTDAGLKKLKPADPNATYVVLDGTKPVFKGSLGDCSKQKLLNRALKVVLWKEE